MVSPLIVTVCNNLTNKYLRMCKKYTLADRLIEGLKNSLLKGDNLPVQLIHVYSVLLSSRRDHGDNSRV